MLGILCLLNTQESKCFRKCWCSSSCLRQVYAAVCCFGIQRLLMPFLRSHVYENNLSNSHAVGQRGHFCVLGFQYFFWKFFPIVYYIQHRKMWCVSSRWGGWALWYFLLFWSLQQLKWAHTAAPFLPMCGFPPKRIRTTKRIAIWLGVNPKKCTKKLKLKACHRTDFSGMIIVSTKWAPGKLAHCRILWIHAYFAHIPKVGMMLVTRNFSLWNGAGGMCNNCQLYLQTIAKNKRWSGLLASRLGNNLACTFVRPFRQHKFFCNCFASLILTYSMQENQLDF